MEHRQNSEDFIMAINLIGESRSKPGQIVHSPVSAQSGWGEFWLPVSQALRLKWIPEWEWGVEFYAKDIPNVIQEFTKVKDFVTNDPASQRYWQQYGPDYPVRFSRRIEQIVELLSEYEANEDYVWSIGI